MSEDQTTAGAPSADKGAARKRILVAFTGAGHEAEAMAHLVGELESRGHEVELVSFGGLAAETARQLADKGMRGLRAVLRTVTRSAEIESEGSASGHKLDAVVATSFELARSVKRAAGESAVRVGLLTDLDWNPAWTEAGYDALVVPHPVFRELALRRGVAPGAALPGGVPLSRSFSRPLDVEAIRARFGLDAARGPVVLVMAEGIEHTRLERLVFQLSLVERPIQPIFFIGTDRSAGDTLRRAATEYGVLARLFGAVDNLEEYFAASDLVLGHAMHPLVYAVLALDKPLVLVDADGERRRLEDFLDDVGAAIVVPDMLRLGAELDALLRSPQELERLRTGARQVVDQQGVTRIADAIEDAIARREELRPQRVVSTPRKDDAQRDAFAAGGAFEVIGSASEPTPPPPPTPPQSAPPAPSTQAAGSVWGQESRDSARSTVGGERVAAGAQLFESGPSSSSRRLSRAEAQEEMAALILMERDVEKRLADATRYVSQWEGRLDLARQAGEPELAAEAERFLTNYRREETVLLREIDRIRDQKNKLRRAVHGPGTAGRAAPASGPGFDGGHSAELEGRFRSMELERDLDRLKGRLRGETGDE